MEIYYLIIVVVLFALAISDLIVGVSNDAVNFLNSAIGSKAGSFKLIMIIAAAGVLFGATFSSGMMEVARKGIFHPGQFAFSEIMIIFLAVMLTDVVLLDLFNTFGLPTSTTVSIVFELLGAAVAVSIIKITGLGHDISSMGSYINSSSALLIISGILLSVFVAFTIGVIIQWLVRIMFTFNYEKTYKYFSAFWGGIAITIITYFILIKGAKGSSFLSNEAVSWIRENTWMILSVSFVLWTGVLQLLMMIFRLNVLKFTVLFGTFALAMAFAGNDLVNFIGVPLAGFESFKAFSASILSNPSEFFMSSLGGPIKTPTYFLLLAGLIMVVTLRLSKKARSVTATTIDLSRQDAGHERFETSALARNIVRGSINIHNVFSKITTGAYKRFIDHRFSPKSFMERKKKENISFDLVRASVNLVVASALIALGTSLKLPLSTTYVTFMVAMGTSLADRAWGRESAVFRISGVITVIGGWFFTALSAFTAAFLMAWLIHLGGIIAIALLVGIAGFFIFKTHTVHKKRDEKQKKILEEEIDGEVNGTNILKACNKNVFKTLSEVSELYNQSLIALAELKRKKIKKVLKEVAELNKYTKRLKDNLSKTILKLQEDDIETGHYYVQVLDYLRETAHCLTFISAPIFEYIDNNHPPLNEDQVEDIHKFLKEMNGFFNQVLMIIKGKEFKKLDKVNESQNVLIENITRLKKKQLKRIKNQESGTKNSILYLNVLTESKNLLLYIVNLLKANRDFIIHNANNLVK